MTSRGQLCLAAAALVAAFGTGCGGSGSTTGSLLTPKQKTGLTEVHPKEAPAKRHKAPRVSHRHRAKHAAATTQPKKQSKVPGANLPTSQQILVVKRIVPAIVGGLGFGTASIQTNGKTATIGVSQGKACAMGPAGPATLQTRLASSLPFVKSLAFVVSGTQQPLAAYAKVHCSAPKAPTAPGRLVLTQKGASGMVKTKQFKINSSKWTITYASQSQFFQVFVLKNGRVQPTTISTSKPGTGKQTVTGSGTFMLQITAAGSWNVQVRDGG